MRVVKNQWFQVKAPEASRGRHGGKVVWKCIRDMQRSRSLRVIVGKDEDGNLSTTAGSQQQRLKRHFTKVRHVQSLFGEDEVNNVREMQVGEEMAEPPTKEEFMEAVAKVKSGKAADELAVLPEMVKVACCDEGLWS